MIKIQQIFPIDNQFGGIKRHCVDLCSLFQNDNKISIKMMSDNAVRYIPVIRKMLFRGLYNKLKMDNSDIMHIHGFAEFAVVQAIIISKLLGKKIVYSPHFHPMKYLQHPILGKIFFICLLRPVLSFVSEIITISKEDTMFFKKYHSNVVQIPHYYKGQSCSSTSISKKTNMILFVGRNEANKGLDHLYKLPSKYEVHCVTKGVLQRKDFIMHSDISDQELGKLYSEAALVVIPSRYEAFSYVALEAFAHGTPVVMSDRVQIASYLKGKSGYRIFKYADYQDFLTAVEHTINMTVDVDGIMSMFDRKKIKEQYEEAYCQLVG